MLHHTTLVEDLNGLLLFQLLVNFGYPLKMSGHFSASCQFCILGDPGATSRDDVIFRRESLL